MCRTAARSISSTRAASAASTAELVRDFERWVNKKYAKQLGKRPLTVYIVAATRDKLLRRSRRRPRRHRGRQPHGHRRAAEGSSISSRPTSKRRRHRDPGHRPGIAGRSPRSTTSRARPCTCARSSSYYDSLDALNERFKQAGKPAVKLVLVPDALEDEDMLEMLNAGLLQAMVVDDWKAKMWAQVLPKIKVHEDIVLREATKIGWAIRKDSPKLAAELDEFYATGPRRQAWCRIAAAQYMKTHQGAEESRRRRGLQALRGHDRALREVRQAVQLRSADAGRAGLPGVARSTRTRRATSARSASCSSCRRPAPSSRSATSTSPSRTSTAARSTWTS